MAKLIKASTPRCWLPLSMIFKFSVPYVPLDYFYICMKREKSCLTSLQPFLIILYVTAIVAFSTPEGLEAKFSGRPLEDPMQPGPVFSSYHRWAGRKIPRVFICESLGLFWYGIQNFVACNLIIHKIYNAAALCPPWHKCFVPL